MPEKKTTKKAKKEVVERKPVIMQSTVMMDALDSLTSLCSTLSESIADNRKKILSLQTDIEKLADLNWILSMQPTVSSLEKDMQRIKSRLGI